MNNKKTISFLVAAAACAVLSGCGGGGSLDDGQSPLRVEPGQITLQSATSSCPPAPGSSVTVFALGGVAPYSLRNPLPSQVSLDKDSIANTGEGVKVTFTGGCMATIPLVFIDKIGNTTSVSMTYAALPS